MSQLSMYVTVLPLPILGTVNFVTVSSFIISNQHIAGCWINHKEAHEVNTYIVFTSKSALPH
jgi:hypothetical protein